MAIAISKEQFHEEILQIKELLEQENLRDIGTYEYPTELTLETTSLRNFDSLNI